MFKKYRLNKLNIELRKKDAEYIELIRVTSLLAETNNYYVDTGIRLRGEIAVLRYKIVLLE